MVLTPSFREIRSPSSHTGMAVCSVHITSSPSKAFKWLRLPTHFTLQLARWRSDPQSKSTLSLKLSLLSIRTIRLINYTSSMCLVVSNSRLSKISASVNRVHVKTRDFVPSHALQYWFSKLLDDRMVYWEASLHTPPCMAQLPVATYRVPSSFYLRWGPIG